MDAILQGTTPTFRYKVKTTDFLVTDVTKLELTIQNMRNKVIHGLDDVTVDTENNRFIYKFTEQETLALNPADLVRFQLRFMFADGSILGSTQIKVTVSDLMSEEVLSDDLQDG